MTLNEPSALVDAGLALEVHVAAAARDAHDAVLEAAADAQVFVEDQLFHPA